MMISLTNAEGIKPDHNMTEINISFYEKYDPQIRAIVARILGNANRMQDIEDCVNDVYVNLLEKLQQYNESRGSMGAFVAVIARSAALNYRKSSLRKTGELIGDDKIDFLAAPLEYEDETELKMLVESIIANLNEKERVLFTMRYVYYYSTEEIAKIMKINRGAVDMRVSRLKNKVKKFLIKGGINI